MRVKINSVHRRVLVEYLVSRRIRDNLNHLASKLSDQHILAIIERGGTSHDVEIYRGRIERGISSVIIQENATRDWLYEKS